MRDRVGPAANGQEDKKVFYQTKTDQYGLIDIPTNYLPVLPYHISYKASNNNTTSSQLSSFVQQNRPYLDSGNTNLMATKNIKSTTVTTATQPSENNNEVNNGNVNQKSPAYSSDQEKNQSNNTIIFTIIICVLVAAVAGAVLYFNSKKRSPYKRRK